MTGPSASPFHSSPSAAVLWEHFAAKAALLGATVLHAAGEDEAAALLAAPPGSEGEPPRHPPVPAIEFAATAQAAVRFPRTTARCQPAKAFERGAAREVVGLGQAAVAETGSV